MRDETIAVCMCTYNGERYLREQLDSIAAQTRPPGKLVAFDDGSSDRTVDILRDFASQAPFPVQIEINGVNLGPALNFSQISRIEDADYVFSCDQDDVWLPEKISTEMAAMRALEDRHGADVPLLVHSDLETVDQDLKRIAPSFMASHGYRHSDNALGILIAQNFVTGCTTVVNRPAIEVAMPVPEAAIMHDWWMALVVAVCGHIGFVSRPMVRYRQHESNRIGARPRGLMARWRGSSRRGRKLNAQRHLLGTIRQAEALKERLIAVGHDDEGSIATLDAYSRTLSLPFWLRAIHLIRQGIIPQPVAGKIWFTTRMTLLKDTVPDAPGDGGRNPVR